jgi:hypothetical protein
MIMAKIRTLNDLIKYVMDNNIDTDKGITIGVEGYHTYDEDANIEDRELNIEILPNGEVLIADDGDYVAKNYYGGDAYTGIQHAAAETGQNVRALTKLATKGFGSILLVGGLALVVVGIPSKKNDNKPCDETKPNIEPASPQTDEIFIILPLPLCTIPGTNSLVV